MDMQATSKIRPLPNRLQGTPSAWLNWVLICALLLCQSLGLKHRIEHHEFSLGTSVSQAYDAQIPNAKIIKDHHCSLLDALTLSSCLNVETYALDLIKLTLVSLAHFELHLIQQCAPCYFQSRAPPSKN